MEEVRGSGRGSYIWGRSVHNIRIERLWVDVTSGFGNKWKEFFRLLEASHGLQVDNDAHIWLLHHLFLDIINADAAQWAATWNQHVVSRRSERHLTPAQMYIRGIAQHGQRGIQPPEDPGGQESEITNDEDFADYGIDWDELEHTRIRTHHHENNPDDGDGTNPFVTNDPEHLSHVEVPDFRCPFTAEQVVQFDLQLAQLSCYRRKSIQECLELWITALYWAQNM
ncbi:hypothetical protein C8Q79DRAFT_920882 [Trametes meyenii]|nr:hypothetical protein C8Q79DRAFT_920882 [Trametes meyenii]